MYIMGMDIISLSEVIYSALLFSKMDAISEILRRR